MSSLTTYCPRCGHEIDSVFRQDDCPHCAREFSEPQEQKLWGVGTGFLVWLGSVGLLIGFQTIAIIIWLIVRYRETGAIPQIRMDWLVTILSVGSSFPAHILTLIMCWLVVTANGRRSFEQALGLSWHTQFKWVHAVALALLMVGFGSLIERVLPHQETELEQLLRMGVSVRIMVAALAVLTAPFVEEIVYRGILYSGIERTWGRNAGIVLVTLLFGGVHYFQYRESIAALTMIMSLSLVLTLLRAVTGKLLPCIATHLAYNGLNAVFLLMAPDQLPDTRSVRAALVFIFQILNIKF